MKDKFAKNIYRFRKDKGQTQEGLAQQLGVAFQAISKIESKTRWYKYLSISHN